ncbi:hypothetical protein B2A_09160 [mine drainage metagenome]|uniref:Transposase IS66 central domain-containing protein n=1 Tax=mine drainage metagenome TaxID=410659 RepID=T0ZM59_9ZZZZ
MDSIRHVPSSPALSDLSRPELEALLAELLGKVLELEKAVAELREENARLKGLKGRPDIKPGKPSGMDKATEQADPAGRDRKRRRGKVAPRVTVENKVVKAAVPEGSRFKGHEPFLVQELVISATAICYQRERWVTPDGRTVLAPLPDGIDSHFGPELRRFVLMQYHQGQSTLPRIAAFLRSVGVAVSKRQLQRLLTGQQETFVAEAQNVLRAGLETSPYVSVDDTGARHAGKNGYCTQIGNDLFAWFGTRTFKSRLNFLELLRAGQFNVGHHALCWVHAERLMHKLDTFTDAHRAAQAQVRGLIWDFYSDLKDYRLKPGARRAAALRKRFDRIFLRRTGFVTLDRLLKRLHANKAELLTVLDRPATPLHTNGSESDIRCYVTRRKLSAGTRSDIGRDCRDAFLGLAKTCAKLGIEVWDYLGSRLKVAGSVVVQPLDVYVRGRFRPA